MHFAATHNNMDFDALACLVAATFVYPGTIGVVPRQIQPAVREFLAIHRDLFRLCSPKELDPDSISRLVVVDTNHWHRLDALEHLKDRPGLEVFLWDHHMEGGNVEPAWKCQEETGAAVTLLLREIRRLDRALSPVHATLFLLGIYEDTGQLLYPSTTPEDILAAAFLIENGADLNVAAAYLQSSFDDGHTNLLTRMFDVSETFEVAGATAGVALLPVDRGLNMLSSVVGKFREIKGLDSAFGVFFTEPEKTMIIGRAGNRGVNVGAVTRKLAGNGHPGAGSAMVKGRAAEEVHREVKELLLDEMRRPQVTVREIMSRPLVSLAPGMNVAEARNFLAERRLAAVVVAEGDRLFGTVSPAECARVKEKDRERTPVKGVMRTKYPFVHPDRTPGEALRIMVEEDPGILPVIEDGRWVGVLTRADLMLQLYDF